MHLGQKKFVTCVSTCLRWRHYLCGQCSSYDVISGLEGNFLCHLPFWCILCQTWQFGLAPRGRRWWLSIGLHLCTVKAKEKQTGVLCCCYSSEKCYVYRLLRNNFKSLLWRNWENKARFHNTFFLKLPFLSLIVLGTVASGVFLINSAGVSITCLYPSSSPARFCSQQMLSWADHLNDLSGNNQKVVFQMCEQTQCSATWSVVSTVEGMCSWGLSFESTLPAFALFKCKTALSVKRLLKSLLKKNDAAPAWMNKSVAYHDNDKNHRCPPYQDCCNKSCVGSWRAGLGALALASRQCVSCGRLFLVPLRIYAAGSGVWNKSTKEVAVPGSLVTPMCSRC